MAVNLLLEALMSLLHVLVSYTQARAHRWRCLACERALRRPPLHII